MALDLETFLTALYVMVDEIYQVISGPRCLSGVVHPPS